MDAFRPLGIEDLASLNDALEYPFPSGAEIITYSPLRPHTDETLRDQEVNMRPGALCTIC
jgi:hypothetical protein